MDINLTTGLKPAKEYGAVSLDQLPLGTIFRHRSHTFQVVRSNGPVRKGSSLVMALEQFGDFQPGQSLFMEGSAQIPMNNIAESVNIEVTWP